MVGRKSVKTSWRHWKAERIRMSEWERSIEPMMVNTRGQPWVRLSPEECRTCRTVSLECQNSYLNHTFEVVWEIRRMMRKEIKTHSCFCRTSGKGMEHSSASGDSRSSCILLFSARGGENLCWSACLVRKVRASQPHCLILR